MAEFDVNTPSIARVYDYLLGGYYIGTEHILLALLELEDSPLLGFGIDKARTEAHITEFLAGHQENRP